MSIELMRAYVAAAYPGDRWARKVRNMPDAQILVIYYRLLNSGKLEGVRI